MTPQTCISFESPRLMWCMITTEGALKCVERSKIGLFQQLLHIAVNLFTISHKQHVSGIDGDFSNIRLVAVINNNCHIAQ